MTTVAYENLLSQRFCLFYESFVEVKNILLSDDPQAMLPESMRDAEDVDYKALAAFVSSKLSKILAEQKKDAESYCTAIELKFFDKAQYLMAALADELLILQIEWDGAEFWHQYLLEKRLFSSDCSGSLFFENMEPLLLDRSGDVLVQDLAAIYLMCLRLGFSGRFRGESNGQRIAYYEEKLLTFLGGEKDSEAKLFRQNYLYSMIEPIGERMAPFGPWIRIGVVLAAVYLVVSGLVWQGSINELLELISGKNDG